MAAGRHQFMSSVCVDRITALWFKCVHGFFVPFLRRLREGGRKGGREKGSWAAWPSPKKPAARPPISLQFRCPRLVSFHQTAGVCHLKGAEEHTRSKMVVNLKSAEGILTFKAQWGDVKRPTAFLILCLANLTSQRRRETYKLLYLEWKQAQLSVKGHWWPSYHIFSEISSLWLACWVSTLVMKLNWLCPGDLLM